MYFARVYIDPSSVWAADIADSHVFMQPQPALRISSRPFLWLLSVSEKRCGVYMGHGLYWKGPGFSDLGEKGDDIEPGYNRRGD